MSFLIYRKEFAWKTSKCLDWENNSNTIWRRQAYFWFISRRVSSSKLQSAMILWCDFWTTKQAALRTHHAFTSPEWESQELIMALILQVTRDVADDGQLWTCMRNDCNGTLRQKHVAGKTNAAQWAAIRWWQLIREFSLLLKGLSYD